MGTTNNIKISASGLNSFFTCPMAYWLGTQYRSAKTPQHFIDGSSVHKLMEGKEAPDASPRAKEYYQTLKETQEKWDILIDPAHHEIEQIFEIYPGINLHRIIDAIGFVNNIPVLIDWKTSSSLDYWDKVSQAWIQSGYSSIAPKASGFQALAYLLPPPKEMLKALGLDSWPQTIYFVVGTSRGEAGIFPYSIQEGDTEVLISAARIMAGSIKQGLFPRVRGEACHSNTPIECGMLKACFETKGWESFYVEKSPSTESE